MYELLFVAPVDVECCTSEDHVKAWSMFVPVGDF